MIEFYNTWGVVYLIDPVWGVLMVMGALVMIAALDIYHGSRADD